jgi:hypothetical protein
MCELWVDGAWTTEIDGKGVRITYKSGADVFVRRMARSDYRKGLEAALRQLNEYEARERCEVVPIKRRGGKRAQG